jgi:hypothetical protein
MVGLFDSCYVLQSVYFLFSFLFFYCQPCSRPVIGQLYSLFSIVIGLSPEASAMLLAVIIGGYTLIGK